MGSPDYSEQVGAPGINQSFGGKNKFFTAVDEKISFLGLSNTPYTKLWPSGSGLVDVANSMNWSNLGDKSEVPAVYVVEKELKYGTWAAQLSNLLTQAENAGSQAGAAISNSIQAKNMDSYMQLYAAAPTGFKYNFPWLLKNGDNIRNISNTWGDAQGLGSLLEGFGGPKSKGDSGAGAALLGAGIGAAVGTITPGFGYEDTKEYKGTSQQSLNISFPLYNTIDMDSAFSHFSFVNLFTFQNLKTRTSLMTFIPPKIYEIDAYAIGGIYMAAAYVSDFKVDSIGTTRALSDYFQYGPSNILMPEAFRVSITFTDLLSQSSNVFAGTMGGVKVQVSNNVGIANQVLEQGKGVIDYLGKATGLKK